MSDLSKVQTHPVVKEKPSVYAIIVTFNGEKYIRRCLHSLLKCLDPNNIIVVDNASVDHTVHFIKQINPNIKLLKCAENLGFGRANNIGIMSALELEADFIYLVNQDVYQETSTLTTLINVATRNSSFGIIAPIQINGSGNSLDYNCSSYINNQSYFSSLVLNLKPNEIYETRFINAACWLISIKCIQEVGGFDPLFFHYGEDEDYVKRAKYKGFKVGFCPFAKVIHDRPIFNNYVYKPGFEKRLLKLLIQLKDINYSFKSILSTLFKYFCREISANILKMNLSELRQNFKLIKKTMTLISKIKRHRQLSEDRCAFLNDDLSRQIIPKI